MSLKFLALCKDANKVLCKASARHIRLSSKKFIELKEDVKEWKQGLQETIKILPNFVNEEEETLLMEEIEPYMKNLKYEFDHWDDAIHGYRETEWLRWNKHNSKIIDRIRTVAFPKGLPQLSLVHILDLSEKGWIKPHIDSVRFCGEIIAGLSLLTDSVMRFTLVGHEKECYEDFLLPRRSLYIISGMARYKFNHEILKQKESFYQDKPVIKTRRISVICRCEPNQDNN